MADQRKSGNKLSEYLKMEAEIQQQWKESKLFEANAQSPDKPKYFATFPYPYMNGILHLGHSFSMSKVEFAVAYQRHLGKNVLFPFAYHCTGMPILACADKLRKEMELYGVPPKFPLPDKSEEVGDTLDVKKKSKVQAKTGPGKSQWAIMVSSIRLTDQEMVGLTADEKSDKYDQFVAKFSDPKFWFDYFPKQAKQDLELFGLSADWRRSFITTDVNPFYDSFVRWQFLHLKKKNKIKYGKRYTVYSIKDGQPCMDHDRATGEGVGPQRMTLIKIKLTSTPDFLANVAEKKTFFLASTATPETMYGPTKFWLKPDFEFIAFNLINNEIGICTHQTALNLAYQDMTPKRGQVDIISEFNAKELSPFVPSEIKDTDKNFVLDQFMAPEKQVISRSGDECIVALCDQWYLDYEDEAWKEQVREALKNLETYSGETRAQFEATIDWLHGHACSRTYGLGTKLPWDENWLIESLSDSTIYMAYYTVAHLLQANDINGNSPNASPLGIKPEQMTPEVWDYIFLGINDGLFSKSTIPAKHLQLLRKEFSYWYPMDMRTSGKDLIPNHLTYCLYNHCAIWDDKNMWPKSIRANGHLLLNGEKMSKSTGNFLTLERAINLFSADAVRFTLADAGDTIEDANFVDKQAETAMLKLHTYIKWTEESVASLHELRDGPLTSFPDRAFENEMNRLIELTKTSYDKMMFREALLYGFFEFQELRTKYNELCGSIGWHRDLKKRFIQTQPILINPICPHAAQKLWTIVGKDGFIAAEPFPQPGPVDVTLHKSYLFLNDAAHDFRVRIKDYMKPPKAKKGQTTPGVARKPTSATIYVAKSFPPWQAMICQALQDLYIEHGKLPEKKIIASELAKKESLKPYIKKAMPFVEVRKNLGDKESFDMNPAFNERQILEENFEYLINTLEAPCLNVTIKDVDDSADAKIREECCPTEPLILFSSD